MSSSFLSCYNAFFFLPSTFPLPPPPMLIFLPARSQNQCRGPVEIASRSPVEDLRVLDNADLGGTDNPTVQFEAFALDEENISILTSLDL